MHFMLILLGIVALDQAVKYYMFTHLLVGESVAVLPSVFNITLVLNPGAAFGMLAHKTNLFIVISTVIIIAVLIGYRYLPKERIWSVRALAMVVGGATGNLIDRVRLGQVIDFIDFRFWPVFNIADVAIVVGVVILLADIWCQDQLSAKKVNADVE